MSILINSFHNFEVTGGKLSFTKAADELHKKLYIGADSSLSKPIMKKLINKLG
jgi:hypothetical protein